MGINRMQGTSSHIEYIGQRGRKFRKNCIHYTDSKCSCKSSQAYMMKCVGRLCCGHYEDSSLKRIQLDDEKESLKNAYTDIKTNHTIKSKNSPKGNKKNRRVNSVIIKNVAQNDLLGKTFRLRSLKFNEDITIKIVTLNEQSEINRKYSTDSIFARSLVGKKLEILLE